MECPCNQTCDSLLFYQSALVPLPHRPDKLRTVVGLSPSTRFPSTHADYCRRVYSPQWKFPSLQKISTWFERGIVHMIFVRIAADCYSLYCSNPADCDYFCRSNPSKLPIQNQFTRHHTNSHFTQAIFTLHSGLIDPPLTSLSYSHTPFTLRQQSNIHPPSHAIDPNPNHSHFSHLNWHSSHSTCFTFIHIIHR